MILSALWRSADAAALIKQGSPFWLTRRRYRINAASINVGGSGGVEVRSLPIKTSGMDSAAGGTDHDKSTKMAAITHVHLVNKDNPRKAIDYHVPIECSFRDVLEENLAPLFFIALPSDRSLLISSEKF